MTASVTTVKAINSIQFCDEVAPALVVVRDDGTTRTIESDALDQAALQAAVDAHVAIDYDANRAVIVEQARLAMTVLADIINTPQVAFSNLAGAQTAMRQLQAQVKDEARVLRRLVRLAVNDLTGSA